MRLFAAFIVLLCLIAATPASADSQSGSEYTVQPWDGTVDKPAPNNEGGPITFTVNISEQFAYGCYSIALARGIPGVIWLKESPDGAWRPDLLLTLRGINVQNILRDERPGIYWFTGVVFIPEATNAKKSWVPIWVMRDLGDGSPGHYGSATTFSFVQPADARPIYESTSDKH